MRNEWRSEVFKPVTGEGQNYCIKCNMFTMWSYGIAYITRWFTNTRNGEPTRTTDHVRCLKCGTCGRSVMA